MNNVLPVIYLIRHGETEGSLSGRHTGLAGPELTERGERNAYRLGGRSARKRFAIVLSRGLKRADRTCTLAGFGADAEVDRDLVEWDYGDYEGRRTVEFHSEFPDWNIFRDGSPAGESPLQVGIRADRVLRRIRSSPADVLLFSSGDFLRVLAARWLGLEAEAGQHFTLNTASISVLGYEHDRSEAVTKLWNDTSHTDL